MIAVGEHNILKVTKSVTFGLYLSDGEEEVLLPLRFIPEGTEIGDEIKVFVYHDNEGRKIATTMQPVAEVGELAVMTCKSVVKSGAFLNWGIMKDVFIPAQYMTEEMKEGKDYFVYLFIDDLSGRVVATQKVENNLYNDYIDLKDDDEVSLIPFRRSELGLMVAINKKYLGLLHESDIIGNPPLGKTINGYIKKIREDDKIDVAMSRGGYKEAISHEELLVNKLRENAGKLYLTDKSSPDEIYEKLGMSKKNFKMLVGSLYKKRLITLHPDFIQLVEE